MKLVVPNEEQNQALASILCSRLGGSIADLRCLAGMQGNEIVGIIGFFNYRWPNIEVAFYCDDWRWAVNRDIIAKALSYPFEQLKCKRITALVERKNLTSRKMVQRLGFKEEGKLRDAGEKGDIFVYGLLPHELKIRRFHREKPRSAKTG